MTTDIFAVLSMLLSLAMITGLPAPAARAQTEPVRAPLPVPVPAAAQNSASTLSLDQALTRVYRDNAALWHLRQEQLIWAARVQQAGLGSNPEFSLVSEDFAGSAAFTDDRFTQFTLGLAQTLVLGNKLEARVRLAQTQQQLAYWDYRLQLRSLGAEVYRVYARLLSLASEQALLGELIANARAQHALFEKAVSAGRQAPAVLFQSQSQVKALEAEAMRLEIEARGERQRLAMLWGGSGPDFERLTGNLPLDDWGDWASLEAALQSHPRLARWQIESQQRERALEAARAQAAPDINLSGGLRYHPPLAWGLVLSLGVPFPIANLNQGQIEEARLRGESWQHERELEARSLRGHLRKAYDQAQGQAGLISLLREQIALAVAQRDAAAKTFAAGRTGAFELLLAGQNVDQLRRKLAETQGARLQAVVEVLALTRDLLPDDSIPAEAPDALRR